MAIPSAPEPVQLFAAVLMGDETLLPPVRERLAEAFGPVDFESGSFPFDVTGYYEPEMGAGLRRRFLTFERLISPEDLARVKLVTNRIEDGFVRDGRRRVNLDPGYMDIYKIVLASAKFQGPKVYVAEGICADLTLYYDRGWKPFPWGFPDFRDGRYDGVLTEIRRLYKAKRKRRGPDGTPPSTAPS
jgi:hypothetical protein